MCWVELLRMGLYSRAPSFPVLVTVQVTDGKAAFAGELIRVLFSESE